MNEHLSNADLEHMEILRESFKRLGVMTHTIADVATEALRIEGLPDYSLDKIESLTGKAIKILILEHLKNYMVGPTSIRGLGTDLGVPRLGGLSVDDGEMYDVWPSERKSRKVAPLPDREWFRNYRGILGAATTMKAY